MNPNIFRESYNFQVTSQDFHTVDIPDALKSLFAIGTIRELKLLDTTASKTPSSPSQEIEKQISMSSSKFGEDLAAASTEMHGSLVWAKWIHATLREEMGLLHVDRNLWRGLRFASANREARSLALNAYADLCKDLAPGHTQQLWDAAMLGDQRSQRDATASFLGDALKEVEEIQEHRLDIAVDDFESDAALHRWEAAVAAWKRERTRSGEELKEVTRLSKEYATEAALIKGRLAPMKSIMAALRQSVVHMTQIAEFCVWSSAADNEIVTMVAVVGDRVRLDVLVKERYAIPNPDSLSVPEGEAESATAVSLPVVHSIAFDVSAGMALTWFGDPGYYVEKDSLGTSYLRSGAGDSREVAPALMGHILYKISRALAGGVGVGLTTTSPPKYLLGLTIQVGEKYRLSLSGGLAYGTRTTLQGQSVDQQVMTDKPRTRDRTGSSGFGSLGISIALPKP